MARQALITGGGTGIGREMALELARRGYDVALIGRRPEPIEAVAEQVRRIGQRAVAVSADVATPAGRDAAWQAVQQGFGALDLLINNAAVLAPGPLATLSAEEIERAVATNLTAPLDLTRRAIPELAKRQGGVILMASGASYLPLPYLSAYCATKAGLQACGDVLRFELRSAGVTLLLAYPPFTATDMTSGLADAAGVPGFPQATPAAVAAKIIKAHLAGRRQVYCAWSDWSLSIACRLTPRLLRGFLRWQQARFERMTARKG